VRRTALSKKELRRGEVLGRVKRGELGLAKAAEVMRIGYRQAKRLWKKYQKGGTGALKHGNAGRKSNRARPAKERSKILKLVRRKYSGDEQTRFGPTLAAEHLASEDQMEVHPETLRRWMLAEGLWSKARNRKQHRQRRERREHFGELVQLDGSFHKWYQKRGPKACLMDMVDDASSTVEAYLDDEETIWAAARVLRQWIGKYGVPLALYTDWKNVYAREPTEKELLHGQTPVTQFWTHVPEAGYSDHHGQLAGGQRESRAQPWDAPGSFDQEDGSAPHPHPPGGQPILATGVSGGSQRAVRPRAVPAGGLSPQGAQRAGTGTGILLGDRAQHFQRLGGAL